MKYRTEQRGFMLTELVCSLALAATLAAILAVSLGRVSSGWQYVREQTQLQQAGCYIQSFLEKNLAYNAVSVSLNEKQEIAYNTILGNKKALIYTNKQGLYQRTVSGFGDGTNPLFVPPYIVQQWQVRQISSQQLYISFWLQGKYGRSFFEQLILCCNGEIHHE